MARSANDRMRRDNKLHESVLQRAAELMDTPVPLKHITIGQVARRSGIAASTILSQSGLESDDDDGRAEVFRRLLFRRLIADLSVALSPSDRQGLIEAVATGLKFAAIVESLIDSLSTGLVASPQASYFLAAARHNDDPLLEAEVEAKWREITEEPAFLLQLLASAAGYEIPAGVDQQSIQAGIALALSVEYLHRELLPDLDQPRFTTDGVEFGPGALVLWGLLAHVLRPLRPDVPALGQVGLVGRDRQ